MAVRQESQADDENASDDEVSLDQRNEPTNMLIEHRRMM